MLRASRRASSVVFPAAREGQHLDPGCAAYRRTEGSRRGAKIVHMRIVGGENAMRHFGEKQQIRVRAFTCGGERSRPEKAHRPERCDCEEDVR